MNIKIFFFHTNISQSQQTVEENNKARFGNGKYEYELSEMTIIWF
jgi:hypothetical protein